MYQHSSQCSLSHLLLQMATFCTSMGGLFLLYVAKTSSYLHNYFPPEVIFLGTRWVKTKNS